MTTLLAVHPTEDRDEPQFPGLPSFRAAHRHGRFPDLPPAVDAALVALDRAEQLVVEQSKEPVEALGPFVRRTVADLLAGGSFPEDFAEQSHRAKMAAERRGAASSALGVVQQQLKAATTGVIRQELPGIFAPLRAQLDDVMSEARAAHEALGALDTRDPGAVAGATDKQRTALLALQPLVARYNQLRRCQRAALETGAEVPGMTSLTFRPHHTWRTEVYDRALHEVQRGGLPANLRPVDRIRTLAARPDVWLPEVDELDAAHAALTGRAA